MRSILIPLAAALLAAPAPAQSLNLRVTDWTPPPSPTYGGVTGQTGVWNALESPVFGSIINSVVDLAGNPTPVTVAFSGCDAFMCDVIGFGPDVQALFAGTLNGDCFANPTTTRIQDLQPGHYVLTVIASPCYLGQFGVLEVSLSDGSYNAVADPDGDYEGSFDSMDLGTFEFDLDAGVKVHLVSQSKGHMSAAQLARIEPPIVYCTSKVNSQGCAAKIAALGNSASLSAAQPFHVVASDVIADSFGLMLYGLAADTKPFFGGTLCVEPPATRTTSQTSGGAGVPCAGTFDLDVNAWLATDPAPKVYAGSRLYAQYWYRDPADPFGASTSDAVSFHVVL